jgi:glutamate synthase (NADPH/NADH) small chain
MNCGVPFCHSGCPLGNVIPEFNDAVYRQNWKEAYDILSSTITSRVYRKNLPRSLRNSCVLGINQPRCNREIEKHIIEIAFDKGLYNHTCHIYATERKLRCRFRSCGLLPLRN